MLGSSVSYKVGSSCTGNSGNSSSGTHVDGVSLSKKASLDLIFLLKGFWLKKLMPYAMGE